MRNQQSLLHTVRNFLLSSLNKEFLIFLFFLALSGSFWLMMTLNITYDREFKIPTQLIGVPRNAIITGNLPDSVRVTLRDKGFTLATYMYGRNFRPLTFRYATYAREDKNEGVIPMAEVTRQVQSQIYGSTKLISVKPDKLDFFFSYGESKRVPVRFKGHISTSGSYYLAHTELMPQTVTVYASKDILEKLEYVDIEPLNYKNLQDTVHQNVRVAKIRGVKTVPDVVRLSIYPDVLTEEAIEVPIQAVNMPEGMLLRTFPAKATVKFSVGASRFRSVKPDMFTVVADYKELVAHPNEKCTLQLRVAPTMVGQARLANPQVDYLLEQR